VDLDLVIAGGTVVDGTGRPGFKADVGVAADRVVALGDLGAAQAARRVDAAGLVVAPGFVDVHTHSDTTAFLPEAHADLAHAALLQGVTTEICGNCGFSVFPHPPGRKDEVARHTAGLLGTGVQPWADLRAYALDVDGSARVNNLAALVGHGSLRAGVVGFDDREPDAAELKTMASLLRSGFDQGAVGLSSGLVYPPAAFARTDELVALCQAVADYGRPYVTHVRDEADGVATALTEAVTIARSAGMPLHVSHHKVAGRRNSGRSEETLGLLDAAGRDGVEVTMDAYPYTSGSTVLYGLLPPWVSAGGAGALVEALGDRGVRARLTRELREGLPGWANLAGAAGWAKITVASCPTRTELEGRSILEAADEAGSAPEEFAFDLLVAAQARVTVIMEMMDESDVRAILAHERTMIGSDGIPLPGKPHPRWAGTFVRVLGPYVRDLRVLDLVTAVRKMTGMPARRFGLRDRGEVRVGALADLVVFDPAEIADRSTPEHPLRPPLGVDRVIVAGREVAHRGKVLGERPGRFVGQDQAPPPRAGD
jgi:N-acyl-D-amino-acid deacylase